MRDFGESSRRCALLVALAGTICFWPVWVMAATPVPLNTFQQEGPTEAGNWIPTSDGTSVSQSINGAPTFFVSPRGVDFVDVEISFDVRVSVGNDDDFVGFVVGYREPLGEADNFDLILLDWRGATQEIEGRVAEEGFTLSRVDGTPIPVPEGDERLGNRPFWDHSDPSMTVLATSYGAGRGWVEATWYTVTVIYQTDRIRVDVAGGAFGEGETVFDIKDSFTSGRFGFYNYSQPSTRYQSVTAAEAISDTKKLNAINSILPMLLDETAPVVP